jgi:hypothetical protein
LVDMNTVSAGRNSSSPANFFPRISRSKDEMCDCREE